MACYYAAGKSDVRFNPKSCRREITFSIIRQGYSGSLSRFVEMFRCFIINVLIIRYVSTLGLSAFAAVNSVMAVFWPVPFGMVAVARMLMGVSIGEEDRKSVADIMRVGIFRGGLLQIGISALIVALAVPIASLFWNPGDPAFGMTVTGFRILPLCMPLSIVSLLFACYAQAAENRFLKLVLPIVDGALGVVVCSLLLIPPLKLTGLYVANVLNGVICLALVILYAASARRRMPRNMEDLLVLPEGFGVPETDRIDIEVRRLSEVVDVSGKVVEFCRQHGVDERRAAFAGLALEEMAGNVVSHGFSKDKKQHYVDIRVIRKRDDIILRVKDNCIAFNPSEHVRMIDNPDDPISNAGIRIVFSLAREVQYQHLLGLNVLTIKM